MYNTSKMNIATASMDDFYEQPLINIIKMHTLIKMSVIQLLDITYIYYNSLQTR